MKQFTIIERGSCRGDEFGSNHRMAFDTLLKFNDLTSQLNEDDLEQFIENNLEQFIEDNTQTTNMDDTYSLVNFFSHLLSKSFVDEGNRVQQLIDALNNNEGFLLELEESDFGVGRTSTIAKASMIDLDRDEDEEEWD